MKLGVYELEGGGACPEQYDVLLDGERIGYLRLWHGSFRAEYKEEVVYRGSPEGDGRFEDHERLHYLTEALKAIDKHRVNEGWSASRR